MSKLTDEELKELKALEEEEKKRAEEESVTAKRQHLEALRLSKKLSAKHGVPGRDFLVLETKLGNIAIRRPVDVEIDEMDEDATREQVEKLALSIVIEPKQDQVQAWMAEYHSLGSNIVLQATKMLKVMREEASKK